MKFTCSLCQGSFESTWSEEEARKEAAENGFDFIPDEDMEVVCDDCYQLVMARPFTSSN